MEFLIEHIEDGHRGAFFVARDGRRIAELTYSRANAALVIIDHTDVAAELAGQGVGLKLVLAAVVWARETGTKLMATCPFALKQIKGDSSLRDVLA